MENTAYLARYEQANAMSWRNVPTAVDQSIYSSTEPREIYKDSRAWSDAFSSLLYTHISGQESPSQDEFQQFAGQYSQWVYNDLPNSNLRIRDLLKDPDLAQEVDTDVFSDEAMKERFHASFHDLNIGFLDAWATMFGYNIGPDRRRVLNDAAFSLAMKGCLLGATRDGFIKDSDEATYFEPCSANGRSFVEFVLNEIDAGIVLTEFAKSQKEQILILPGPSAFETLAGPRSATPTNANADYIVVDPVGKRTVGVQVKSKVTSQTRKEYDDERIVLLDTQIDLGNQAPKNTERRHSDKKIVGWAGLIAVEAMNRVNPKSAHGKHLLRTRQLGLKQYARRNAKGLSPQLSDASERIGERILQKL